MLLLAIKDSLPRAPITDIYAMIRGFRNLLHDMPDLLQTVHDLCTLRMIENKVAEEKEVQQRDHGADSEAEKATVSAASLSRRWIIYPRYLTT